MKLFLQISFLGFNLGLIFPIHLVQAEEKDIHSLPDEVLVQIFQFCPLPELANLSQACRHWHQLIEDNQVWRHRENEQTYIAPPQSAIQNDSNQPLNYRWKNYVKRQVELRNKVFPRRGRGLLGFLKPSYILTQAVRILDNDDPLHLAIQYSQKGQYEEALVAFGQVSGEKLEEKKLEDPEILGILGDCYFFTGQFEKAELYYKDYFELISKENKYDNRLNQAVSEGNIERVRLLLRSGADPKQTLDVAPHRSPLIDAIFRGNLPMVQLLVESGIDLKHDPILNETIAMAAIDAENSQILKYLLEQGLLIN